MKHLSLTAGLLAITATIFTFSSQTNAQPYRAEVGVAHLSANFEDVDTRIPTIGGVIYQSEVDQAQGPLAEAAFISKASSFFGAYSAGSRKCTGCIEHDVTIGQIGGEFRVAESPFMLGLTLEKIEYEALSDYYKDTISYLNAGYYVTDNTKLGAFIGTGDRKDKTGLNPVIIVDQTNKGLTGESLITLQNETALKLSAEISELTLDRKGFAKADMNTAKIASTYYLNQQLGFGVGYENSDSKGSSKKETYTIQSTYFVNDSASLGASYGKLVEDNTSDLNLLSLSFNLRI